MPRHDDNEYQEDLTLRINMCLDHPLYSGAIIMSCFLAPLTDDQIAQTKLESYLKEIDVMDTEPYFPNFDFRPFFGEYNVQLHPSIPANPPMAKTVHQAIQSWTSIHSSPHRHHVPRLSTKLLPRLTRQDMDIYLSQILHEPSLSTQGTLEWLWMKYGVEFTGKCEVKQRWYTNGLSPRTYYVCGPTLFNSVKYTQDLWNDLCDRLEVTNRRNRVNPHRIHIDGVARALFYDLSSFTSNCAAQREFLQQLALYVDGLPFIAQDSRFGLTTVDFGDVIRDYANSNIHPEYSTRDPRFEDSTHGVAGFLGVYGNIATCTFLHGAVVLQLASDTSGCGCAGDDAVIVTDMETDSVWICISLLGVLAMEKTFSSEDPDVLYLKRRVWFGDRRPCQLNTSRYIQLPSFLFTMNQTDLKRFREGKMTKAELKKLACSSLGATYKSSVPFLNSGYMVDIRTFLQGYYKLLKLPIQGNVPQFSRANSWWSQSFVPNMATLGYRGFIEGTINILYPGWCNLPDRITIPFPVPLSLKENSVVRLVQGPNTSLYVKMGVLEPIHRRNRLLTDEEGLKELLEEYSGRRGFNEATLFRVVADISDVPCPPEVEGEYAPDESNLLSMGLYDDAG